MVSQKENRQIIENALKEHPDWSNRRIGLDIGACHPTINSVRLELEAKGIIQHYTKLLGLNGKWQNNERMVKKSFPRYEIDKIEHYSDVVYFIESIETKLIKVGYAHDLTRRIRQLSIIEATTLRVLATTVGSHKTEKSFHYHFIDLNHHGEWFHPGEQLLDLIDSSRIAIGEKPLVRSPSSLNSPSDP